MKDLNPSPRRNFLKQLTVGTGALAWSLNGCSTKSMKDESSSTQPAQNQIFNMCGYAAPKMDIVRLGIIGVGSRGSSAVARISQIADVEIKAISDKFEERVRKNSEHLVSIGLPEPDKYYGNESEWKKLCERDDIDLVYICTPWAWHTPMAVYAMEQGKHAVTEVPAAKTLEEAWQLVETSEKTRKHCMMLENCCYDFFELLTMNMARDGFFGEILHAEGAYLHTLIDALFDKNGYSDMWRLEENRRNGNLYPTHGLGPVCQIMNINRGDKMDYMTSVSSNDFQLAKRAEELAKEDDFYSKYAGVNYRGNMNTSIIRTNKGKTIMIQHDVTSPHPYSRIHLLAGTRATARKWPEPARVAVGEEWLGDQEMKELEEKYTPEIVKHIGKVARKVGGHGGMDFIMDWRLFDCLRNGLPLDHDVYDAALWSSIAPLSEQSVANRSASVDVPDFTRGSWETNNPVEMSLEGGGTTLARELTAEVKS